jgi:hypothetical protein
MLGQQSTAGRAAVRCCWRGTEGGIFSCAEFNGIHLWCKDVFARNSKNVNAVRKNGIIINDGNKLSDEEISRRKEQNKKEYALCRNCEQ